ncbi:unnamed protein product, partial [Ilex paraguariensis]
MMPMTCHSFEFGRTRLDLVARVCSSDASFDRFSTNYHAKGFSNTFNGGYRPRKLFCGPHEIPWRRVFSEKTRKNLLNGAFFHELSMN